MVLSPWRLGGVVGAYEEDQNVAGVVVFHDLLSSVYLASCGP
jgi:hypothetical protein